MASRPLMTGFTVGMPIKSSGTGATSIKSLRQRWVYGRGGNQIDPIVDNIGQVILVTRGRLVAVDNHTGH